MQKGTQRKRKRVLLFEYAYKNCRSLVKANHALLYVVLFGEAFDQVGEELNPLALSEHYGVSKSAMYRHRDAFRDCLGVPGEVTALEVWKVARESLDALPFPFDGARAKAAYLGSCRVGLVDNA